MKMKGLKFLALEQYLENYKGDFVELTFTEIERIIGEKKELAGVSYKCLLTIPFFRLFDLINNFSFSNPYNIDRLT